MMPSLSEDASAKSRSEASICELLRRNTYTEELKPFRSTILKQYGHSMGASGYPGGGPGTGILSVPKSDADDTEHEVSKICFITSKRYLLGLSKCVVVRRCHGEYIRFCGTVEGNVRERCRRYRATSDTKIRREVAK